MAWAPGTLVVFVGPDFSLKTKANWLAKCACTYPTLGVVYTVRDNPGGDPDLILLEEIRNPVPPGYLLEAAFPADRFRPVSPLPESITRHLKADAPKQTEAA